MLASVLVQKALFTHYPELSAHKPDLPALFQRSPPAMRCDMTGHPELTQSALPTTLLSVSPCPGWLALLYCIPLIGLNYNFFAVPSVTCFTVSAVRVQSVRLRGVLVEALERKSFPALTVAHLSALVVSRAPRFLVLLVLAIGAHGADCSILRTPLQGKNVAKIGQCPIKWTLCP